MKKTITTKALQRWRLIDRLSFFVPVVFFVWQLLDFYTTTPQEELANKTTAVFIACLIYALGVSFPIVLIWRAVSWSVKKSLMKKNTFYSVEDLDYYREKLTGLSPSMISILTDLQIEPRKDAAALILKCTLLGAVKEENGAIVVVRPNHPALMPSDHFLLAELKACQGNMNALLSNLSDWKALAKKEALQTKYFKRNPLMGNGCLSGCLSGCLLPILGHVVLIFIAYYINDSGYLAFMDSVGTQLPNNSLLDQIDMLIKPELLPALALVLFALLVLSCTILLPLAGFIHTMASAVSGTSYIRTPEGDQLTEYIYGMKNFIHDFSNLQDAEKQHLILWDDFLIYAVLLEENDSITNEIFKTRNIHPHFK